MLQDNYHKIIQKIKKYYKNLENKQNKIGEGKYLGMHINQKYNHIKINQYTTNLQYIYLQ